MRVWEKCWGVEKYSEMYRKVTNFFLSTQALNFWENNEKLQTAIHFQAGITRILILFRIYCKSIFILTKTRMPLHLKFKLLNNPNYWCHTSPSCFICCLRNWQCFCRKMKVKKKISSEKYYIWLMKWVWTYSLVSIQVKVPKLSFVPSSKT